MRTVKTILGCAVLVAYRNGLQVGPGASMFYYKVAMTWAVQRAPIEGVGDWLAGNQGRAKEFLEWTKSYQWAEP